MCYYIHIHILANLATSTQRTFCGSDEAVHLECSTKELICIGQVYQSTPRNDTDGLMEEIKQQFTGCYSKKACDITKIKSGQCVQVEYTCIQELGAYLYSDAVMFSSPFYTGIGKNANFKD